MILPKNVTEILLNADGKALATYSEAGVNVVPVSTVKIMDGKIWLINYFLGKTLQNILQNNNIALAFWKGLEGYQIKGELSYIDKGEMFEKAKSWIAEILPDRQVKGLLIITPRQIFDVSASAERAGAKLFEQLN